MRIGAEAADRRRSTTWLGVAAGAAGLLLAAMGTADGAWAGAGGGGASGSTAHLIDALAANPRLAQSQETFLREATAALVDPARPIVRRVTDPEQLGRGADRSVLDPGAAELEEGPDRVRFALAREDANGAEILAQELPRLAAAYRLGRRDAFLRRILEQLEELAGWDPLQRGGWAGPGGAAEGANEAGSEGADGEAAEGKEEAGTGEADEGPDRGDGVWRATAFGVRAVTETMEILPRSAVPDDLRARVDLLLLREIARIADDLKNHPRWVELRRRNPLDRDYLLLLDALVRGTAVAGRELFRDEYVDALERLGEALDAAGSDGGWGAGFAAAHADVGALLSAVRAAAARGDRWVLNHRFFKHFPTWYLHHLQPGQATVNTGENAGFHPLPAGDARARHFLSRLALTTGDEGAYWALLHRFDGPSDNLEGLLARSAAPPGEPSPPIPHGAYQRGALVAWRSGWKEFDHGVWIRGGHPRDAAPHTDRGHVNLIAFGQPLLIEAGNPPPGRAGGVGGDYFRSAAAHNVLQPTRHPAYPMAADFQRPVLGAERGRVDVIAGLGYPEFSHWGRRVSWESTRRGPLLRVEDNVHTVDAASLRVTFRWHLGTDDTVDIRVEGPFAAQVSWAQGILRLETTTPFEVDQVPQPNYTLAPDPGGPPATHTCLLVSSKHPVAAFRLTTIVRAR